jgi:DNA polymerase III psi subunit
MNFDQFHLPGFLLRDLYKESLVQLNDIRQLPDTLPETTSNVLGNNKRQVLILVRYNDQSIIAESDLSFLLNILKACKLSLNDVSIVNMEGLEETSYQQLIRDFTPKTILLFDVLQTQISLPVHFPDFQVQSFMDIRFISSPALKILQQDEDLKRKLWSGLKQIFLS